MKDLVNKIPIELTQLLNSFNQDLSDKKKIIKMTASEFRVRYNNSEYDGIKILYKLIDTSFFIELDYLLKGDVISWRFYPQAKNSTKEKKIDWRSLETVLKGNILLNQLRTWKNIIAEIESLENPLEFFAIDDFIKFYAGEFIDEIVINEQDEKLPLSSSNKEKVINLIAKQSEFLEIEISEIEDSSSEKYNDLLISQKILGEIQENISRKTVAEIKRNWSISLGAIRKWCEDKYLKFLAADKSSNYELSRSLGSFIGGLFGFPRLDG